MTPNLWSFALGGSTLVLSPYMLLNGAGLIVGLMLLDRSLESSVPDHAVRIYGVFVTSVVVGWMGAHLFDWWVRPLSFSESGFTFYGGFLAGSLFFVTIAVGRWPIHVVWNAANAAVIPLVAGHAVGRIGCFLGGCCYGKTLPHGALFERHPTQLYEAGFLVGLAIVLARLRHRRPHWLVATYLVAYGTFRFAVEFLRDDPRGGGYGLSTSQWVSAAIVTVVGFAVARALANRRLTTHEADRLPAMNS